MFERSKHYNVNSNLYNGELSILTKTIRRCPSMIFNDNFKINLVKNKLDVNYIGRIGMIVYDDFIKIIKKLSKDFLGGDYPFKLEREWDEQLMKNLLESFITNYKIRINFNLVPSIHNKSGYCLNYTNESSLNTNMEAKYSAQTATIIIYALNCFDSIDPNQFIYKNPFNKIPDGPVDIKTINKYKLDILAEVVKRSYICSFEQFGKHIEVPQKFLFIYEGTIQIVDLNHKTAEPTMPDIRTMDLVPRLTFTDDFEQQENEPYQPRNSQIIESFIDAEL